MFSQQKQFDKLVVLLTCSTSTPIQTCTHMGRIIAIGDVHGYAEEFAELLQAIAPRKDDRLIQLGD